MYRYSNCIFLRRHDPLRCKGTEESALTSITFQVLIPTSLIRFWPRNDELLWIRQVAACRQELSDFQRIIREIEHRPESLKRRYWGDDVQPCIEKYCMQYVTSKLYWKCLSDFCPAGLLIIPRDLDMEAEEEEAPLDGLTEEIDESVSFDWESVCPVGGAKDLDAVKSCTTKSCVAVAMLSRSRQSALSITALQLCGRWSCRGTQGEEALQCLRQKCCPGGAGVSADSDALTSGSMEADHPLARKRRVNDEVSQCIQSYCSGKNESSYRLWCIVNKCNRG
ncbi:hypothetical protein CAPTEDRAFT_198395 [Capitella teleta]|uniref:Uncharacterized protein n=1 Tax=Capitella teleta TaxID=283909 RepID=R7UJL7_CAPTE|nr:hypothetical protein CAPTEDRAFT_198395 [Capitella teleta]|eukprot:ELU06410.1 hypothetical protein CAPTEDRAFT_198395 [Capitella teleta]